MRSRTAPAGSRRHRPPSRASQMIEADLDKTMRARVTVTLKQGVLDPQGKAIEGALRGLGFGGVNAARQGKVIDLDLAETDPERARAEVSAMCEALLANTVIESYAIELD